MGHFMSDQEIEGHAKAQPTGKAVYDDNALMTLLHFAEGGQGDVGAACRDAADTIVGIMSACARVRRAYLRHLQTENSCRVTGKPCRELAKCGCHLELQESLAP